MNSNPSSREIDPSLKRRTFLKSVLAASAVTCIPGAAVFGKPQATPKPSSIAANEKVNLACCGIGARGAEIIRELYKTGHANIVALCDVDMGGPQTLNILKQFPDVPRFKDFREMLTKMGNQIDAVSVGVPDFSHFPICMMAMALGKHVYVEKPMAHTFQEVELMMKAEKHYKVVAQMGNQGHSGGNYFQFKAWTEAGIIKDVTRIDAFMNAPRRWHGWNVDGLPKAEPIPDTLDWDKWLVTAPYHDFNSRYVQGNWRCWYDFGNGALGDWGAHLLDTSHRFLKLGLPTEVSAVKLEGHNAFIFPQASTLSFKFPEREGMPPVEITWYDGVKNLAPLPEGFGEFMPSEGVPPPSSANSQVSKAIPPGKIIYGKDLTFKGSSHGSMLHIVSRAKQEEMASKLPQVPKSPSNHFLNFLLACKGQEQCRSPFEIAGPLCQTMALGVLAQRLNTKLLFDPKTRQITNDAMGNQLLVGPPPRKGWEEYYRM